MAIKSAFSPFDGKWHRKWPECVSQHDLVYGTPPNDPMQGIPLGNGEMGSLVWMDDSKLNITLTKNDMWDDKPGNGFKNWARNEEDYATTLRHGARFVIDFKSPVFDLIYQQEYSGRLDMAGAEAVISGKTPFADYSVNIFSSYKHKVLVIECESAHDEDTQIEAILERWGSRTFSHWYSLVRRKPEIGTSGTSVALDGDTLLITQQLRTQYFVVGAKLIKQADEMQAEQLTGRSAAFRSERVRRHKFTVYLSAFASENTPDPEKAVREALDTAAKTGVAAIREEHQADWRDFWEKAFIDIPEKYAENIWHLNLYFANCSCRGTYPPHFCNGLWQPNRDFVPWNYYFHWNMQYLIAPMFVANHLELSKPYFDFRFNHLKYALESARDLKHVKGAYFADVADKFGHNDPGASKMLTPAAQIAMEFWRYYRYTLDEAFLKEKCWPVLKGAADFYADIFKEEADGKFHIYRTQAYEGTPLLNDTITDITMAKALYPVALEVARMVGYDGPEIETWEKMAGNIVDFTLMPLYDEEIETKNDGKKTHATGLGKGAPIAGNGKVISIGKYVTLDGLDENNPDYDRYPPEVANPVRNYKKGEPIRSRFTRKGWKAFYGVPDSEIAPVYPAGLIGLSDAGSELFEAEWNQLAIHPTSIPDKRSVGSMFGDESGVCMGWCPFPIAMARLGMGELLATELGRHISTWQFYCQGFGHYGPYQVFAQDFGNRWATNRVKDADTGVQFDFPKWNFRHFDNEAMPILSAAMNEMALQSHESAIRVFGAVPAAWTASFRLAAAGGFIVNSEIREGRIDWICIESKLGADCAVVSPWGDSAAWVFEIAADGSVGAENSQQLKPVQVKADQVLNFKTKAGRRYILSDSETVLEGWTTEEAVYDRNKRFKQMGDAKLGLEKNF